MSGRIAVLLLVAGCGASGADAIRRSEPPPALTSAGPTDPPPPTRASSVASCVTSISVDESHEHRWRELSLTDGMNRVSDGAARATCEFAVDRRAGVVVRESVICRDESGATVESSRADAGLVEVELGTTLVAALTCPATIGVSDAR